MPYSDPEERRKFQREYMAEWRKKNPKIAKENDRRQREKNREKRLEYSKKYNPGYWERNKDELKRKSKKYYEVHSEEVKERVKIYRTENRIRYQEGRRRKVEEKYQWWYEYRNELKCARCPESDPNCIDFHHRNPKEKESSPVSMVSSTWSKEKILTEIAKCDILCANCHRKEHARLKNGA